MSFQQAKIRKKIMYTALDARSFLNQSKISGNTIITFHTHTQRRAKFNFILQQID